jgi:hypothetical protein
VVHNSGVRVRHLDEDNGWWFTCNDGDCFVAGTQVVVAEYDANDVFVQYVAMNIESVKIGDIVLAKDQNDPGGALIECVVVNTFMRYDQEVATVTLTNLLTDETLEITGTLEHPFYVVGKGFINLGDLEVGDICVAPNGSEFVVQGVVVLEERQTVYNFEVEGGHTYYVGLDFDSAVLVHNAGTENTSQDKLQVIIYVNLGTYASQYDIQTIQDAMNQILENSNSDIRVLLILTTRTEEEMAGNLGFTFNFDPSYLQQSFLADLNPIWLIGAGTSDAYNWWNRENKFMGHYVKFQQTGPGLGFTPNRTASTVHIDQILQEKRFWSDAGYAVISDVEVIANVILHEVLYHGLLGKWDKRFIDEPGTLYSTSSSARGHIRITPPQQRNIDWWYRKGGRWL